MSEKKKMSEQYLYAFVPIILTLYLHHILRTVIVFGHVT